MVPLTNLPELLEPRRIIFADATMAAQGAYTDSDEMFVSDADFVNFYFEYIRGAGGGALDVKFYYSPYASDAEAAAAGVQAWFQDMAYTVGAIAAGVETRSRVQRERLTYQAEGALREMFMLQLDVKRGMERLKVALAESGSTANPGDAQVTAYLGTM